MIPEFDESEPDAAYIALNHANNIETENNNSEEAGLSEPGLIVYVSTDGDDNNTGEIGSPLATLNGARMTVRGIKEEEGLPDGGVTVYFKGGHYYMEEAIWFYEEDSGEENKPIIYTAYPGETPVFTGGLYYDNNSFSPVSSEIALRIPEPVRDNVYIINLLDNGFTRDDIAYENNLSPDGRVPSSVVYINDTPLHMARYPNKVPGIYEENPYHDYIYIEDGGSWADGSQTGLAGPPVFMVPQAIADRMASWDTYNEVFVSGMITGQWLHEHFTVNNFDFGQRVVELGGHFPVDEHRPPEMGSYYFQNVLEELDAPGEFYIDAETGILLFYPPEGIDIGEMTLKVPKMNADMIVTFGASWLIFNELTFELNKKGGINPMGGAHITADSLTIKNMGGTGIYAGIYTYHGKYLAEYYGENGSFQEDEPTAVENGLYYTIQNCDIINMGSEGARIYSGRVSTRESGHFLFYNNYILNTGFISNMGGVQSDGVGVSLLQNTVKFTPGFGMGHNGPDGIVAYNELIDVMCDPATSDSAGLALHHGGLAWGLKVHDNIIRDIQKTPIREWGWGHETMPTRMAIYVDGPGPGAEITRNVIYNAPQGIWLMDPHLYPEKYANNLFIDVMVPVQSAGLYNLGHLEYFTALDMLETDDPGSGWAMAHFYMSGVYKTAWRHIYPEFYDFFNYLLNEKENFSHPLAPIYNNICVNINVPLYQIINPETTGYGLLPMPPESEITPDARYGSYENNHYIDYDPGFVDYENGNIQLTEQAAASLGVEWIDLSKTGVKR